MFKKLLLVVLPFLYMASFSLMAQDTRIAWSPEEQKELFGYCEKPALINQLKLAAETADKIGQINYWATIQKIKVAENTNDTFVTANEVEEEVVKKYKALSLSGDQLKTLIEKRKKTDNDAPCAIVTLTVNHSYDTLSKPQMVLLFKSRFRKKLIDGIGINGRQADMLIDAEVWQQKEALQIAAIPITDFNRIRKTVEMNTEKDRKYRLIDLTEQQKESATLFFKTNQL